MPTEGTEKAELLMVEVMAAEAVATPHDRDTCSSTLSISGAQ